MEIKAKRGDLLATLYWTQSIVERDDNPDSNFWGLDLLHDRWLDADAII